MNKREKAIKNEIKILKLCLDRAKKIDFDRDMSIEAYDDDNSKLHIPIDPEYTREVTKNLIDTYEKLLKIEEDKLKQLYSEQ